MKYLPDVLTLAGSVAILNGVYQIYTPAAWVLAGAGVLTAGLIFARDEARTKRYRGGL